MDRKLIEKYGVDVSRWERVRRKRLGLANVQYIRHDRFFLLMATHGQHRIFEEEAGQFRDARRVPIRFAGYSVSVRQGRVSVRIDRDEHRRLKAWLLELAERRPSEPVIAALDGLSFAPYKPIRRQLLGIWRAANRVRQCAGYERISVQHIPWQRSIVRPFCSYDKRK